MSALTKIPPTSQGRVMRLRGIHAVVYSDPNIAVSCVDLCFILWVLDQYRLTPAEVHCIVPDKHCLMNALFQGFASLSDRRDYWLPPPGRTYCFDRFVQIKRRSFWSGLSDPACLEKYRRYLLGVFHVEPAPPVCSVRRMTFICRNNAKVRKIANEEELLAALRKRFPEVRINSAAMEELALEEQFRLINQTDVLIGMHGAGLAHIFALPPGAGVLELFPCHFRSRHHFYTFYAVAAARGLAYDRWIQYRLWRDCRSPEFVKPDRADESGLLASGRDLSSVSPRLVAKRLEAIIRQIECRQRGKMGRC